MQWDGHYGSIGSAQNQKANQTASFAARGMCYRVHAFVCLFVVCGVLIF